MKKKISMKEIAELAGVSVATVSRVINNNGRFSEETRQKVLRVIEEYDYTLNGVAKSLRTQKTDTIGIIVPDISNEYFSRIVLAIERYCFARGYTLLICNTDENAEKEERYLNELKSKNVDGLIYISSFPGDISDWENRIVCVDRNPSNLKQVPIVESDNVHGGYLAGKELLASGAKKILVLRDYRDLSVVTDRCIGFEKALNEAGLTLDENLVCKISVGFQSGLKKVTDLIDRKVEFDGVFATSDPMILGALAALEIRGIEVPGQVKLVGYDDTRMVRRSYPAITSVRQDKDQIGESAAQLLLDLIEGRSVQDRKIIVPVELVRRRTTG